MANSAKKRRVFSDDFKRHIVAEIEAKLTTVRIVMQTYEVSETSVYKWLRKYGTKWQPATTMVVQMESETLKRKTTQDENQKLKEMIGQKTIELDIAEQIIIYVNEEYGIDLKKSTIGNCYSISTKTNKNIPIPSRLYYKLLEAQNKLSINIKPE